MPRTNSEDMLKTAARSRKYLGSDSDTVGRFVMSRRNADGGFCGRSPASDLYYTVFALDALSVVGCEPDHAETRQYVEEFGAGQSLDFVHLACLARCLARLFPGKIPAGTRCGILSRVEEFRARDGGYNVKPGAPHSSAYACLLASMLYEDLGAQVPRLKSMGLSLRGLGAGDGGFANEKGMANGTVTATAAAMSFMRRFNVGSIDGPAKWLLAQCCNDGGFLATPGAPFPDLLSTATALYALSSAGVSLDAVKQPSLDFVESLMNDDGGFCGHGADLTPDCEYTFYGLLAIGSLV